MRQFRRIFASLFIFATLLGAMHEVIHHHPHDLEGHYEQSCPLYLIVQTPAITPETCTLETVLPIFEPYVTPKPFYSASVAIANRSRSPPLA